VQFKRTWPIAPEPDALRERWRTLVTSAVADRPALFHETRDRKIARPYVSIASDPAQLPPLASLDAGSAVPRSVRYAYRSFDRQYCLADGRLGDFLRPSLWRTLSSRQLFMTTLLSSLLGDGPAVTVTHLVPDMHHFRGSFGAKDVIPLWRDTACAEPNIAKGVLMVLAERLGRELSPEELFAYCYSLLAAPSYTARFHEELEIPGPRVPIAADLALFEHAVALGRELVWLHTFGERFVPEGHRAGRVPQGEARYVAPIRQRSDTYPEGHSYDPERRELHVGEGVFAPVAPEVRAFSVSGLDVVGSWLDYRMKDGAGRRSSPLDMLRPEVWPEVFTQELLELLWVIERSVALGHALDASLDAIVSGPTIAADDLPQPTEEERQAPG
jgi:hypothetical protein